MPTNWTTSNPVNHTLNSAWPAEVRSLKQLLLSRLYYSATEPTARPDSTAFEANDNGSIWIDSDDNVMYILTAYAGPTWTKLSVSMTIEILAVARTFLAALKVEMADATFTLTNTDAEDAEGGRQSKFIAKGLQSGDEETTLGYIEFAHSGSADDQKGRCRIVLNDGDDDDAPSKIAIDFDSDGSIDAANSVCVLDEDDLVSDSAVKVATQQSIKAYIDTQLAYSVYTANDSESNAMLRSTVAAPHAYLAATDGFVNVWTILGTAGNEVRGYVHTSADAKGAGTIICDTLGGDSGENVSFMFPVASGEYFEIVDVAENNTPNIRWKSRGTLSAPVDQD